MLVFERKSSVRAKHTMCALETCAISELKVSLHSIGHGIMILDGGNFLPCAVRKCILDCKLNLSVVL